ncbi:Glucose-1-phosphate cytidylyltransferase [subsurface metagenome]
MGLINGGFMVFNNKLLDYLTPEDGCDLERGVFKELTKEGEIMVYRYEGNWACMDHERDVEYLNKLWNSNNAFWKIW